jgi:hypothetical protein
LDRDRLVEPEGVLEAPHVFRGDARVVLVRGERPARGGLEDRERDDRDAKEERDRLDQPAYDISAHSVAWSGATSGSTNPRRSR